MSEDEKQEWRQLTFEFYRQLSTLSGAGAVVVLAVYQQEILDQRSIGLALVNFGLSAVAAILGMLRVVVWFPYERTGQRPDAPFLAQLSANLLILGVWLAVSSAFDFSHLESGFIIAVGIVVVIWMMFGGRLKAKIRGRSDSE